MGSKRGLSAGIDTIDLGMVLEAFERMNACVIEGRLRVERVAGSPELTLQLIAHDAAFEIGEAAPLASLKCHPGRSNHLTMESAILWAMYQLDAKLDRRGTEEPEPK